MNTTHIKNDFYGYSATIKHKGEMPALSTVKKHLRAAKPKGCISYTKIISDDGHMMAIEDSGRGEELIWIN